MPKDDYEAVKDMDRAEAVHKTAQEQYNSVTDSYIEAAEMWLDRAIDGTEIEYGSLEAIPRELKIRFAEISCQIAKARGLRNGL